MNDKSIVIICSDYDTILHIITYSKYKINLIICNKNNNVQNISEKYKIPMFYHSNVLNNNDIILTLIDKFKQSIILCLEDIEYYQKKSELKLIYFNIQYSIFNNNVFKYSYIDNDIIYKFWNLRQKNNLKSLQLSLELGDTILKNKNIILDNEMNEYKIKKLLLTTQLNLFKEYLENL